MFSGVEIMAAVTAGGGVAGSGSGADAGASGGGAAAGAAASAGPRTGGGGAWEQIGPLWDLKLRGLHDRAMDHRRAVRGSSAQALDGQHVPIPPVLTDYVSRVEPPRPHVLPVVTV